MPFVRFRWLNSFSRQLMAASAGGVLFLAGLLAAGLFALVLFQGHLFSEIGASEYAETLGEELRFDPAGQPVAVELSEMSWFWDSLGKEVTYRVLDEAGVVVLSSEAGAPPLTGDGEPLRLKDHNFVFRRDGIPMHGATEATYHEGRIWYVQFASSARLSDLLRSYIAEPLFSRSFLIFCLASLLVYCVVMYFTLHAILKPLIEASAIAAEISPRTLTLGARLQVEGVPSELRPLVENFNAALDRLEHNYQLQQDFLASAAHELKTPLALIRAQIEVREEGEDRSSLLQDIEHMARQIQQLLLLAEASEVQNYRFAAVDVQEVAQEAAGYLGRMADAAGVRLVPPGGAQGPSWQADRGALFTLLKNLLENAIEHAPRGTEVRVEIDAGTLSVRDEGPGVNEENLERIFARFWRGAHRRDHGAGLGLAICREIALAHGWTLSAHRADPGLRLRLSLPGGERTDPLH